MKKQKKVFVDTIHMETQTVCQQNGDVSIFPCEFERGQHIVADGRTAASQKGRMVTADDGTSHFHPYRKDSRDRYEYLEFSDHGEMRETKKKIIFRFAFPKKWPLQKIFEELRAEIDAMESWQSCTDWNE